MRNTFFHIILTANLLIAIYAFSNPDRVSFKRNLVSLQNGNQSLLVSDDQDLTVIPIQRNSATNSQFTMSANIGNSTFPNGTEIDSKMLILISTNETAFSFQDGAFYSFNCSSPCNYNQNENYTMSWPHIVATEIYKGYNISASLPNSTWSLNNSALLINSFLEYYDGYNTSDVFHQASGWIGLGTDGDAINNYKNNSPLFSIFISDPENGQGELIFGNDTTKINGSKFIGSFPTNSNWQMNVVNISYNGSNLTTVNANSTNPISPENFSVPVTFDLQHGDQSADNDINIAFSLPVPVCYSFDDAVNEIKYSYYPDGAITDISEFPDLVLLLEDGSQFPIPASVYMKQVNSYYLTNYGCYKIYFTEEVNSIILGWPFLANYYTIFQRTNDTSSVSLFAITQPPVPTDDTPDSGPSTLWIWLTVGLIAIVVGIVCYKVNQKQKAADLKASLMTEGARSHVMNEIVNN